MSDTPWARGKAIEVAEDVIDLYEAGETLPVIAKHMGYKPATIARYLYFADARSLAAAFDRLSRMERRMAEVTSPSKARVACLACQENIHQAHTPTFRDESSKKRLRCRCGWCRQHWK